MHAQRPLGILLVCLLSLPLWSQNIEVSRTSKRISVTTKETVTVDPDVAVLKMGHHNYAATKEDAYRDNVSVSGQVVASLLGAGIPEANIQTDKIELEFVAPPEGQSLDAPRKIRYRARQSWTVTVSVPDAQKVVDLTVGAGANEVDDVTWLVTNPKALEALAGAKALAKAREIAEQLARGLNAKLGEVLYVSNQDESERFVEQFWMRRSVSVDAKTPLRLFPKKVSQSATVHAVFAIE